MSGSALVLATALVRADGGPAAAPPEEPETEVNILPVIGGTSDIGIGFGATGAIGRLRPGWEPYLWRLELGSMTTFKEGLDGDGVRIPFSDHYLVLTLPHAIPNHLRLDIRPSFTHEGTLKYSGLGNDSPAPIYGDGAEAVRAFEYERTRPSLLVRGRLALPANFSLLLGVGATYNHVHIPDASLLALQRESPDPALRELLDGPVKHTVATFEYGVVYDTRDDEIATNFGQLHAATLRLSPGGTDALPFRYGQANLNLRAFTTPVPRRLTLGVRLVGDVLFGDVPFYELARYDDTYAIGGTLGVRGVPAQRYYGKVKLFGNLEARTDVFDFEALGKDLTLGTVVFFDAGRVWLDFDAPEGFDGDGLGLHWGVGGGLRLRAGRTLVLRADVAWSPEGRPLSAYFQANHLF